MTWKTSMSAPEQCVRSVVSAVFQIGPGTPPTLIVSVVGTVDSGGWQAGELIPRIYLEYPRDGIQEFDFVAGPPRPIPDPVPCPIFSEVAIEFENWMCGFRIHSASNHYEVMF